MDGELPQIEPRDVEPVGRVYQHVVRSAVASESEDQFCELVEKEVLLSGPGSSLDFALHRGVPGVLESKLNFRTNFPN